MRRYCPLPAEVKVVECRINPGTDQSVSWGPGLTLVWKDRTVRPFMVTRKERMEFGVWDGQHERMATVSLLPVIRPER